MAEVRARLGRAESRQWEMQGGVSGGRVAGPRLRTRLVVKRRRNGTCSRNATCAARPNALSIESAPPLRSSWKCTVTRMSVELCSEASVCLDIWLSATERGSVGFRSLVGCRCDE